MSPERPPGCSARGLFSELPTARLATKMAKSLRCFFGLHRWQELRAERDVGWYKKCRDCGKFRDVDNRPKYI